MQNEGRRLQAAEGRFDGVEVFRALASAPVAGVDGEPPRASR
jgi:hypothetical protein